jgi:exopolysaccharide production protein ExoY
MDLSGSNMTLNTASRAARAGQAQWRMETSPAGFFKSSMNTTTISLEFRNSTRASALPAWKRLFDICMALMITPGLLLVGIVAAMVIKLGSRGPLFFSQERVGFRGSRFRIFKFRTMRAGAETRTHEQYTRALIASGKPMAKLDGRNDPRLIPGGAILRATGIDELPQIWNVLRGEMSFVGPRPCIISEYEAYEPRHRERLNAVPGLTGLWQVSGKNSTTFERMVELDVDYSRRLSLGLDLWIVLKTFGALAKQCRDLRKRTRKSAQTRALDAVNA